MTIPDGWSLGQDRRRVDVIDPAGVTVLVISPDWGHPESVAVWRSTGSLRGDATALITVPGSEPARFSPASLHRLRGRPDTRSVVLSGREYTFRHATNWTSGLARDGKSIAQISRPVRLPWRRRSTDRPSYTAKLNGQLDSLDLAMVHACGTVFSPADRDEGFVGVVANIFNL